MTTFAQSIDFLKIIQLLKILYRKDDGRDNKMLGGSL